MKKRGKSSRKSAGSRAPRIQRAPRISTVGEIRLERALAENFIGLQRVMVNLSTKFDSLSNQISKLLELFEISAKSLVKKDLEGPEKESQDMKMILEKLDAITHQSNLIGRGITLMHETTSERQMPKSAMQQSKLMPREPTIPIESKRQVEKITPMGESGFLTQPIQPSSDEYRKSIQPRFSESGEQ